jgi:hypothetical protein
MSTTTDTDTRANGLAQDLSRDAPIGAIFDQVPDEQRHLIRRTINALCREGIVTVGDLVGNLDKPEARSLTQVCNLGNKSRAMMRDALRRHGVKTEGSRARHFKHCY